MGRIAAPLYSPAAMSRSVIPLLLITLLAACTSPKGSLLGSKAGTPVMGGIAIVGSAVVAYLVAHIRTEQIRFARAGLTLMALIVGMAVVGFIDDYLGVRKARNLGLRKRGKTAGELVVAAGFGLLALQYLNVSTHLSFTRVLDLDLGTTGWFILAMLVIYASSNAVNITDGADGLAAGSAAMVFAAFVVIAFWQFRHPDNYDVLPEGARPRFLDAVLRPERIRFDTVLSEEGGRFLGARNRYLIVEADVEVADDDPEYRWLTLAQYDELLRHSFYVNIQARSLVLCLRSLAVR